MFHDRALPPTWDTTPQYRVQVLSLSGIKKEKARDAHEAFECFRSWAQDRRS